MRVARLEVFGFKSFMERLVLPLEGGVTGVVGPNGCGKSNIVDALRWVLGETRAKNLRGELLEDVIFNGTDSLRPLGLAEVSLTLRASGPNFFEDLRSAHELECELADLLSEPFPEESQGSDKERSLVDSDGNSEVNDQDSRAEAASEEVSKRPHLTVISGNLGVESTSESQADQPKSPEPKKASEMPTLLTRYAWLKSVSEVQVTRRLYRSGESEFFINRQPCRLKDLKELFRAAGIGARAYTIVAQGEVSRIVTAKPEERRLILEEAAGVLGFRDKILAANRRLEETNTNISRIDDIVKEVSRQVGSLKRQAARAKNRLELKDRVRQLELSLARDDAMRMREEEGEFERRLEEARDSEGSSESELRRIQAEEHSLRNDLMSLDVEGDSIRLKMDSIREELGNRVRLESDRRSRLSEVQATMVSSSKESDRSEERRALLLKRQQETTTEISGLESREIELVKKLDEYKDGNETALAQVTQALEEMRRSLREREEELRTLREGLVSSQASLKVISEEIAAASPLKQLQESAALQDQEILKGEFKLLIEGLKIAPQYSRATQAILAEKAGFVVVPSSLAVACTYGEKSDHQLPALGALDAGTEVAQELAGGNSHFSLPRLFDLIEVAAECRSSVARLLSGVYVAESIQQAKEFLQSTQGQNNADLTIVTLQGDILTRYSFQSLRHEGGLVQLIRRREELEVSCEEHKSAEAEQQQICRELREKISLAEVQQKEILSEVQAQKEQISKISSELGTVRGQLHSRKRAAAELESDLESLSRQIHELQARMVQLKEERDLLEDEITRLAAVDDAELKNELAEANKAYAVIDSSRKEGRGRLSELAARVEQARGALDAARARASEVSLEGQKVRLAEESLRERVMHEYGPDAAQEIFEVVVGQERLGPDLHAQYIEESTSLRARIAREGDVDPTSIERYEEEAQRLEELNKQRQDLVQAAQILRQTIQRLTETSKRRFEEVFKAVNRNFSSLVPRLFGGGKASLQLTNPDQPLESGVEIFIRPPGKKLRSIDLLSGGEKALCATALIFGMFMERPSPLCVLDEVDAPLDDANLMRFASLIREMSAHTQFLVITHNKQTMQIADSLVGVTMQEPGASKIIVVSLQEAIDQVA